ncbi:MAG: sialidase family protein [Planctomycetaceae bacterium]
MSNWKTVLVAFPGVWAAVNAASTFSEDKSLPAGVIRVVNPHLLAGKDVPCRRTALGRPNDYKPWIAKLKNGELLIVAFCYGGTPSNRLPQGKPYVERAVFWRSKDGGKTWGPRVERRDVHGREFSLNVLSDGTILMPCHFLGNDAANKTGHTHSKLFRSTDRGKTWTETRIGPKGFPPRAQTATDWTVVEVPANNPASKPHVYFGVSMQHGRKLAPKHVRLWHSIDGGRTWDKTLNPDTNGWIDVDGFFSQSVTYRETAGPWLHVVRVDRTGPHWKLPNRKRRLKTESGDQGDRMMLWKSTDAGRTWRKHKDGGRFGSYGEMYPRFLRLKDGRLLLTFTVRSNSTDGYRLGLRAIIRRNDGETWDFQRDRIVIDAQNYGASGGGFGNTIQTADGKLVSVYSYRGKDGKTHIEACRWTLPTRAKR